MKMKKKMILIGLAVALVAVSVMGYANVKKPKAMRRTNDGTYIVTTGKIGKNIKGYAGQTPVKVYIKNDAVVKVEALPNEETAGIFSKVREKLLVKWNGMKVGKIVRSDVDGVSGATYSSKAAKIVLFSFVAVYSISQTYSSAFHAVYKHTFGGIGGQKVVIQIFYQHP